MDFIFVIIIIVFKYIYMLILLYINLFLLILFIYEIKDIWLIAQYPFGMYPIGTWISFRNVLNLILTIPLLFLAIGNDNV